MSFMCHVRRLYIYGCKLGPEGGGQGSRGSFTAREGPRARSRERCGVDHRAAQGRPKDIQPETGGARAWPGVAQVSSLSPRVGGPTWSLGCGVGQAESRGPAGWAAGVGRVALGEGWVGRRGLRAGPGHGAGPGPDWPCNTDREARGSSSERPCLAPLIPQGGWARTRGSAHLRELPWPVWKASDPLGLVRHPTCHPITERWPNGHAGDRRG